MVIAGLQFHLDGLQRDP